MERIVQQLQQTQKIADFGGVVEPASRRVQRNPRATELLGETLYLVRWRAQQHHHVTPLNITECVATPHLEFLIAQLAQSQRHHPRLFLCGFKYDEFVCSGLAPAKIVVARTVVLIAIFQA